jgi:hypothetical protein
MVPVYAIKRRGEIGMLMWILLGVMVLVAVIIVVVSLKATGFSLIDKLRGGIP